MKTLIDFLKRWTSGHCCKDCNIAINALEHIKTDCDARHQFRLVITTTRGMAPEIHVQHTKSENLA